MATEFVNETVYVAVEADVQDGMMTLLWALENLRGHFCILHVHNPSGECSINNLNLSHHILFCGLCLELYVML